MRKWIYRLWMAVLLPCILNMVLLYSQVKTGMGAAFWAVLVGSVLALSLIEPKEKVAVSLRVRLMHKGAHMIYCGLYAMAVQVVVFYQCYVRQVLPYHAGLSVWITNGVIACVGCFGILGVGVLLIFFTSKRLSIVRRLVMLLTMWIPVVNIGVLLYACRLVYEEYDFEREKTQLRRLRVDSDLCKTNYPLVMVHGIGFRDLRYFNYWGRIPRELKRNGALVYYGNQEALGTIVYNAEDIKKRIFQVLEETGAKKVNIIAHSKGGLDSRYAISKLGMAPYVASLTTMNTPHRGCRFVDYACQLPEGLYRLVASCFDRTFRKFGDKNPDFYTATHQFSTKESERFNNQVPDDPKVYYQSYTSKMKHPWSHLLLSIPYCMIKPLEGENDGLVSVDSAKWGEFQGVFSNTHSRGISHGDIIDLKREDYKGFDPVETYIKIVAELKKKGY